MIKVFGRKFDSLAHACRVYHKTHGCVRHRLSKGYTLEEALSEPVKVPKEFHYKGNVYPSFRYACISLGIPTSTAIARVRRGMSKEKALDLGSPHVTKDRKRDFVLEVYGYHFTSVNEACEYFKVNVRTYYDRRSRGLSIEEALTPSKKEYRRFFKYYDSYNGVHYRNLADLCCQNTIDYQKVLYLLSKGEGLREALIHSRFNPIL